MSSYLWVFVLSLATCAGSVAAQSTVFMSATVGSSAVLPCDWRSKATTESASQSLHVLWVTFAVTVFERRGGELYQGEGYEDCVDVPEDHLLKGDCSLELKNVRPEDEGVYESFLVVREMKGALSSKRVLVQSVELSVEDVPEESHSESEAAGMQENNAGTVQTPSRITAFILLTNMLFLII
ncbi:versican core protein-like [Colossoma macropomum]|uniref:versican core protein-like n=1 Tax=Colossoma macropomum TaxID=42526 RepID=UPI001864D2F1|nr:versican core protein-like [Colossoma macropomum]